MVPSAALIIDVVIIGLCFLGVACFHSIERARSGNLLAALALTLAAAIVLVRHELHAWPLMLAGLAAGSLLGGAVARRVSMIQIPALVAFQNGAGGAAACLVATVEVVRATPGGWSVPQGAGLLGMVIGAITFSASMVAAGKLAGRLNQRPSTLPRHGLVTLLLAVLIVLVLGMIGSFPAAAFAGAGLVIALSLALGVMISMRVGGADMPVMISFLNATTGLAAALCGVVMDHRFLVACGAMVAASGAVLTHMMCRAMNRRLLNVLAGFQVTSATSTFFPVTEKLPADDERATVTTAEQPDVADLDPLDRAADLIRTARQVIVVPGYGMALAQAQFEVVKLTERLKARGVEVRFAVHPVAGRMPGHMNVVLAEAEASYEDLEELPSANRRFPDIDLALVVGACDVVNPAAQQQAGTPISGMPILEVHKSPHVIVCNLDDQPGYSGVENSLYRQPNVCLLLGDAKTTVTQLLERIPDGDPPQPGVGP
jgi:H+-translocating NAD(P) transhydrogenase subunit beta